MGVKLKERFVVSRSLADIFLENPEVNVIEFVGFKDNGPFGLSSGGKKLKIFEKEGFAHLLAKLPGAETEEGHISDEGYCIRGGFRFFKEPSQQNTLFNSMIHASG